MHIKFIYCMDFAVGKKYHQIYHWFHTMFVPYLLLNLSSFLFNELEKKDYNEMYQKIIFYYKYFSYLFQFGDNKHDIIDNKVHCVIFNFYEDDRNKVTKQHYSFQKYLHFFRSLTKLIGLTLESIQSTQFALLSPVMLKSSSKLENKFLLSLMIESQTDFNMVKFWKQLRLVLISCPYWFIFNILFLRHTTMDFIYSCNNFPTIMFCACCMWDL